MLSKNELGERIREVRRHRRMTLKELERESGFSATHISEIERGKTSPTIGALVRIARALGKEPSFFLEDEQLSEVALVRRDDRKPLPEETVKVRGAYLTPGIPGGRLNAYLLQLEPGTNREFSYSAHPGEEGAYLVSGRLEFTVGASTYQLAPGDALTYPSDRPHAFRNVGDDEACILFVSTKRVRENGSSSGTTGRIG